LTFIDRTRCGGKLGNNQFVLEKLTSRTQMNILFSRASTSLDNTIDRAAGEATMRIRYCLGILSILVLSVCASQVVAPLAAGAAQSYTIQDIGVGDAVKASGPNLSGQMTVRRGFSAARSSRNGPGELAEEIGLLPGGGHTTTNGINDLGETVGSANSDNSVRAVLWNKNGGLRDLGTLPGDNAAEAFGTNNRGDVVGYSSGPADTRAFLWTKKDGMQNLGTLPGGVFSKAFAISDNGLVVGMSGSQVGTRAVLWDPGKPVRDLGTLPGDTTSEAFAVTNSGSVVGYSRGAVIMRAFLWTAQSGMQALDPLPGGNVTRAVALNEKGEVVGTSGSFQSTRAVLWDTNGQPKDLNQLVSVPAGVLLSEAVGINARGQILVLARDQQDPHGLHEGSNRVFLLTPGGL
jgi:probable HAF family extracellular repeat protein